MIHPAGVAHFLEHKMFEDEDGNALQKFACTGASPNAFTSHTMTAYHFSCTDRFEENLKILLNSCSRRTSRMKTWRRNAALSIRRSAW